MPSVAVIRPARPEEYAAVGELTVRAYAADGHGSPAYAEGLRDAASRATAGLLLVAARPAAAATRPVIVSSTREKTDIPLVEATVMGRLEGAGGGDDGDELLGTAALFAAGAAYAQLAGPGETEIRMLAVDPAARGQGVGAALAKACVQLSAQAGAVGIRLSTEDGMTAAHHIYERLGFRRTPERDWSPVPGGGTLLTYALRIGDAPAYCDHCGAPLAEGSHAACAGARRLEPPRYCRCCARRLVVQVTPLGWSARCARHGERSGDETHLA